MKKKIITLFLAGILALSCTACKNKSNTTVVEKDTVATQTCSTESAATNCTNWLVTASAVKSAVAAQCPEYNPSQSIRINIPNSGTVTQVRQDCSGYVSACLQIFSQGQFVGNWSCEEFLSNQEINGFEKYSWSGWDNLQPGDILVSDQHIEIFDHNENEKHMVWSCGNDKEMAKTGCTESSQDTFDVVWRVNYSHL